MPLLLLGRRIASTTLQTVPPGLVGRPSSQWVLPGRSTTTTTTTSTSPSRRFATNENEPQPEQHQGSSSSSSSSSNNNNNNNKKKDDIDLSDYFDPLLSPHAYPDGVSPNHKPTTSSSSSSSSWYPQTLQSSQPQESSSSVRMGRKFNNPFGFEIPTVPKAQREAARTTTTTTTTEVPTTTAAQSSEPKKSTPDLFDYFDPLLSPHAYPNGISATLTATQPFSTTTTTTTTQPVVPTVVPNNGNDNDDDDDRYNPLRFKTLPFDSSSPLSSSSSSSSSTATSLNSGSMVIGSTTTGINDLNQTTKKTKKKLGILLMDHGSRNPKSNRRLEQLAQLYQLSLSMDNNNDDDQDEDSSRSSTVVQAAHMEIAEPSIEQGLQALLNQGVGT
jgi:hypothetical protein